eukprot:gene7513-16084_t
MGKLSVGTNNDIRQVVGESVILSVYFDWAPMFLDQALLTANGTFTTVNAPAVSPYCVNCIEGSTDCARDWWYGLREGAVHISEPSFEVPKSVVARVNAEKSRLLADPLGVEPFCRTVTKGQQTADGSGEGELAALTDGCLTVGDLKTMDYTVQGITWVGDFEWPGDVCQPGTRWAKRVTPTTYGFECTPCAAGTYSNFTDVAIAAEVCTECPA